jgi:hypothetical protein
LGTGAFLPDERGAQKRDTQALPNRSTSGIGEEPSDLNRNAVGPTLVSPDVQIILQCQYAFVKQTRGSPEQHRTILKVGATDAGPR